jgi:hypothetical protein
MSDTIAVLPAISLPLLLFGLAFVVGCFETRAVNQFESAQLGEMPGYLNAMVADAITHGFTVCDSGYAECH